MTFLQQWDDEIAGSAQVWANQCTFGHDTAADRNTSDWVWVGQNIAKGYGNDLVTLVEMWQRAKEDYIYDNNSCVPSQVCGHYTQARNRSVVVNM